MTIDHVGIIGAGEIGQALGGAFAKSKVQILYYDKDEARTTTASLDDLVKSCQLLLICVPSWANAEVAKMIARAAHPKEPRVVLSLSKGVDRHFMTMDQVLAEHLPSNYSYGLIYGPMVAEEITLGKFAGGVLALSSAEWRPALSDLFDETDIILDMSDDIKSIAICGALKNVYAIAFGMLDGLHLGTNATGKLAVRVLYEMKQLLLVRGGNPTVAEGLAGLGDLLATGINEFSFNFRVGKTIAEGIGYSHLKSEGLVTLKELGSQVALGQYPVLHTLERVAYHKEPPAASLRNLLRRI